MTTDVASPPDIHSAAADTLVLALIREEDSTVESEMNMNKYVLSSERKYPNGVMDDAHE